MVALMHEAASVFCFPSFGLIFYLCNVTVKPEGGERVDVQIKRAEWLRLDSQRCRGLSASEDEQNEGEDYRPRRTVAACFTKSVQLLSNS